MMPIGSQPSRRSRLGNRLPGWHSGECMNARPDPECADNGRGSIGWWSNWDLIADMSNMFSRLLEISSPAFSLECTDASLDDFSSLGDIGISIKSLLMRKNGFFCFESALRFFPSVTVELSWGASDWNRNECWKSEYKGLADNIYCFAEDLFGEQFIVTDSKIGIFKSETGDVEFIASSFEEWLSMILVNYSQMTGYGIGHQWQSINGRLNPRHRLMGKKPFVLGGDYSMNNLVALDSCRLMKSHGNLAYQIHHLPDGSQIILKEP